jgi:hypothetical protein
MMSRVRIASGRAQSVTVIAVTGLGLVLSGCGASGGDAEASPSASGSPAPSTAASATAPTTLKFGQPAVVNFTYTQKKGKLQITVTGITKGRNADLSRLSLTGKAKKMVPYYIHATIKNAGTTDLSLTMPKGPIGVLASGDLARTLTIMGHFAKCDSFPDTEKFPPGKSYRTCAPVLADPGERVTGARWSSDTYTDGPAVTWTR